MFLGVDQPKTVGDETGRALQYLESQIDVEWLFSHPEEKVLLYCHGIHFMASAKLLY